MLIVIWTYVSLNMTILIMYQWQDDICIVSSVNICTPVGNSWSVWVETDLEMQISAINANKQHLNASIFLLTWPLKKFLNINKHKPSMNNELYKDYYKTQIIGIMDLNVLIWRKKEMIL